MIPEKSEGVFLARLHSAAVIAIAVGTAGTIGLFLRAGQHTPRLLLGLMAIWVFSPFIALAWATRISKRWTSLTRATLHVVTIAVALGSLAIYGDDAMGHRTQHAAFVFVLVPPVAWLLMTIAVSMAALISVNRRRAH